MTKEQQDLTWACLPREVRAEIKSDYIALDTLINDIYSKESFSNDQCDRVQALQEKRAIYKIYFGHDNLTSNIEPDELLMVEKKMVQRFYKMFYDEAVKMGMERCVLTNSQLANIRAQDLIAIFRDKCLPDNSGEGKVNIPEKAIFEKWVARDNIRGATIFDIKPIHNFMAGTWDGRPLSQLPEDFLPSLTYDNSPRRVRIIVELLDGWEGVI